ncbi:PREDICTED: tripartite motif-containing protein 2-like [Branchiostoma belcheri]|uniref:Tripartite motif-containing protein 2-like n=1 Tax=Branchiostoma belcheri TaxID=7741 RepID=A0A6P4ZHD7_BRABE|nr:PREDICTED: tripartite motif-containing protein 2-like [Branchiostoma belcheri]
MALWRKDCWSRFVLALGALMAWLFLRILPVAVALWGGTRSCSGCSGFSIDLNRDTAADSLLSFREGRAGQFAVKGETEAFSDTRDWDKVTSKMSRGYDKAQELKALRRFLLFVTQVLLPMLAQERKALRRFLLFVTQVLLPMLFGLAIQRDGRVLVADRGKHSIFLFEADGTLVKQMGGQGKGEGQFDLPCFVCVDEEDNIIVAEKDNSRVQVFDKNFNFQHKFGQKGRQPQNMWDPTGVSADSKGNIVLGNIGMESNVGGVQYGKKLQVFRPDGTWVSTISSEGDKLSKPHGVAVTEDGHLFVADPKDHCIRKYRYM